MTNAKGIKVPIEQKILLSINEAAEYSGIGINRIRALMDSPCCASVVFYNGSKKMVKRVELEKFIANNRAI